MELARFAKTKVIAIQLPLRRKSGSKNKQHKIEMEIKITATLKRTSLGLTEETTKQS